MLKVISWNLAHRAESWRHLVGLHADLALVQEAGLPPPDVADRVNVDNDARWVTAGATESRKWRTAVVGLDLQLEVERCSVKPLAEAGIDDIGVSLPGTLAAAMVRGPGLVEPVTFVSLYGAWERPKQDTGSNWIYADAAVHRLISDLSVLIGQQNRHRIIVAGDLNILRGYGENGSAYWARRYKTVFDRMEALGLPFIGPESPDGQQASPWPDELPKDSRNVPTFRKKPKEPDTATRQLDFVFASEGLRGQVKTRALNDAETWGPSEHCPVEILVG
jgi:hypothetical protein